MVQIQGKTTSSKTLGLLAEITNEITQFKLEITSHNFGGDINNAMRNYQS